MNKMNKVKTKIFVIVFLATLTGSMFFSVTVISYTSDEDELLAQLTQKEVLPDMTIIANATVTIETVSSRGLKMYSVESVSAELLMPVIAETDEDSGRIALTPEAKEEADMEDWGIPQLAGTKTYLVKNTTNAVYTSKHITEDFLVETYPYLLFDGVYSKDGTSAITLTVSFSATATGAWSYNKTLINAEVYPIGHNVWYNLAFETNETYPYCVNIHVQNVDVDGLFVFKFENNRLVADDRYDVTYIDLVGTQVIAAGMEYGEINDNPVLMLAGDTSMSNFVIEASTLEELNSTKLLNVPARIEGRDDMYVRAVGWLTANALETSLKAAWKQQLIQQGHMTAADRITDYVLSHAFWKTSVNQGLTKLMKRELQEQMKHTTDYRSLVYSTLQKTLPLCIISNEDDPMTHIKQLVYGSMIGTETFWDSVKDTFKAIGSGITTVVHRVIDAPANTLEALGNAAASIIKPIGQTITGVVPHATNMIKDTLGHVTNGVVGVAGAAKDLGKGLMEQLKVPLIVVGGIIGLGAVIAGIYYLSKGSKAKSLLS